MDAKLTKRLILATALVALPLGLSACGGKPGPRQEYGPAFVDAMVRCLQDENCQTRFGAARALGRLGPVAAKAVPALKCALGDENPGVRAEVERALERITSVRLALAGSRS